MSEQSNAASDDQGPIIDSDQNSILRRDVLLQSLTEGLNSKESAVLATLARGGSVTLAAARTGVGRSTIYKWLKQDHPFRQVLTQWKEDMTNTARTRLLMLADEATAVVQDAVNRGDTRTCLRVLERLGVLAAPASGSTTEQLRANNLRLANQSRQRIADSEAQADRFLNGLDDPSPVPSLGASRGNGKKSA